MNLDILLSCTRDDYLTIIPPADANKFPALTCTLTLTPTGQQGLSEALALSKQLALPLVISWRTRPHARRHKRGGLRRIVRCRRSMQAHSDDITIAPDGVVTIRGHR